MMELNLCQGGTVVKTVNERDLEIETQKYAWCHGPGNLPNNH